MARYGDPLTAEDIERERAYYASIEARAAVAEYRWSAAWDALKEAIEDLIAADAANPTGNGAEWVVDCVKGYARRLGEEMGEPQERTRARKTIPAAVRWGIWLRDGFACVKCGARQFLTLDHIVPWSKGGSDHPSNLQTLCGPCNSGKGNRA